MLIIADVTTDDFLSQRLIPLDCRPQMLRSPGQSWSWLIRVLLVHLPYSMCGYCCEPRRLRFRCGTWSLRHDCICSLCLVHVGQHTLSFQVWFLSREAGKFGPECALAYCGPPGCSRWLRRCLYVWYYICALKWSMVDSIFEFLASGWLRCFNKIIKCRPLRVWRMVLCFRFKAVSCRRASSRFTNFLLAVVHFSLLLLN